MLLAIYLKNSSLAGDSRIDGLKSALKAGACELYDIKSQANLREDTDAVLSLGGDGTFLSAARLVGSSGIPVLGVNFGRLGFLSEYTPEDVVESLLSGDYEIENRHMLSAKVEGSDNEFIALNEVTLHRNGAAMLGIDLKIDGEPMPTCWADGFLVATSSGSTAYSLSIGGPICTPDADVLVLAPIAPHNLNIRPIVVPVTARIELSLSSRDSTVMVTFDNSNLIAPSSTKVSVSVAQFSLKRIRLHKSNFIQALKNKLFWGEDVRNQL